MMVTASAGCVVLLQAAAAVVLATCASLVAGKPLRSRALIPVATDNSFTWHGGDGSYRMGMRGADQWRVETRDRHGSVLGQYHYRTPDGGKAQVKFTAGPKTNDFDANQRALLALTGRVGGGGELLFDTARPDASALPLYSILPSSPSQPVEQAFDTTGILEQPVRTAGDGVQTEQFDLTQTKLRSEAALAILLEQEGVMPYGALQMVSTGDTGTLVPGVDYSEVNAIVTNVQSHV